MISICGRDNSLCKKMGTSLSPPPPAPALLPGLAASSTELFIGRGAMMMMIMMIEKSNEILLERELYRVGNDRRSNGNDYDNDLRRSNVE